MKIDHILLIGYGAPSKKEEVGPYLKKLADVNRIPESRMEEVGKHYDAIGGASPYRAEIELLAEKMMTSLKSSGLSIPVYAGMKNWHPLLEDVLPKIRRDGHHAGLGIVMAPHRSFVSFDAYVQRVSQLCGGSESGGLSEYHYLEGWHLHPLFVRAHTEEIRKSAASNGIAAVEEIPLIFSSHSIPLSMPGCGQYEREVRESAEAIAEACGNSRWQIAWQSRSGKPDQPWLGPDVHSAISQLKTEGEHSVMVVPLGFVCDNAEILYDLDIDARSQAEQEGLRYFRAATVMRNPALIAMFSELIRAAIYWK